MAFLTGYVLPKAYYEKVGAEGFEKKPIGTGPYMVDAYRGQRLSAAEGQSEILGRQARRSRPWCSSSSRMPPAASPRSKAARPTSRSKCPTRSIDRLKVKAGLPGRRHADLRHRA